MFTIIFETKFYKELITKTSSFNIFCKIGNYRRNLYNKELREVAEFAAPIYQLNQSKLCRVELTALTTVILVINKDITIYEVGLRDGLMLRSIIVAVDKKYVKQKN